jgi:hypothetical protein
MIRPDHPNLSIVRQCRLVSISRSSFYHQPRGESAENLALMAEIDRQFLDTPFYGAQQMTWHLRAQGHRVNIKRVRRLMRLMGLMAIYQRPRTSVPAKGHKTYPYLLRGLSIERPDQVWCADITYIPLAKGPFARLLRPRRDFSQSVACAAPERINPATFTRHAPVPSKFYAAVPPDGDQASTEARRGRKFWLPYTSEPRGFVDDVS